MTFILIGGIQVRGDGSTLDTVPPTCIKTFRDIYCCKVFKLVIALTAGAPALGNLILG